MHNEERIELLKANLAAPLPEAWAEPFHEAWLAADGEPLPLRLARAQAAELAAARPYLKPGELIIGNDTLRSVVSGKSTAFASGIQVDGEYLAQLRQEQPAAVPKLDSVEAYWQDWFEATEYERPCLMHASLAYEKLLEGGIDGLRAHVAQWRAKNVAQDPAVAPWHDALAITLDGVSAFIAAHAQAADAAATTEADATRREELAMIAAGCEQIANGPPRSFFEAVQLFYFAFWLCGHDSPGPIDRYLAAALDRDLAQGGVTLAEAQELVDCLWLKFEEKIAYGATLGGQLADGSDACNQMTLLALEAIRRLRLLSPRTAFRWHPGVKRETFAAACQVVAEGASFPAFVNDEAMIASMVDRGIALEHARDYTFVGCGQTFPHGRGHGNYEDIVVNAAIPLVLALNNGIDPITGDRRGPETGAAEELHTYELFEQAYRRQMDEHLATRIERVNAARARNQDRWHCFMRSMLTHSCVERGRGWHANGADYSEGMIDMVGLPTVTDSLVAVRLGVYTHKKLSLAELRDVLNNDWEGREELRLYFLKKLPKFGNDEPDVDAATAAEVERVNRHIRSFRTVFGGPWGMDVVGWSGSVMYGANTAATPDGRRRGEALADCAGPAQGRNVQGLTPTLHSMLKLPHDKVHGPLVLSLRFAASAVDSPTGIDNMRAVVETYFAGGGQQVQISIADTAVMLAAQEDPDAHRDLMVRVGGFSAYFTALERRFQDDMIARSQTEL